MKMDNSKITLFGFFFISFTLIFIVVFALIWENPSFVNVQEKMENSSISLGNGQYYIEVSNIPLKKEYMKILAMRGYHIVSIDDGIILYEE